MTIRLKEEKQEVQPYIPFPESKRLEPIEVGLYDNPVTCFGFNEDWVWAVQAALEALADESAWIEPTLNQMDFIRQQIYGLDVELQEKDCNLPEWIAVFDFALGDGGFQVTQGGGGTWIDGQEWRSTIVSAELDLDIYRDFSVNSNIRGFFISAANQTNAINDKVFQFFTRNAESQNESTLYETSGTTLVISNVLLETDLIEGVDRIRIRNHSYGGTNTANVRIRQLIVWGEGYDPLS